MAANCLSAIYCAWLVPIPTPEYKTDKDLKSFKHVRNRWLSSVGFERRQELRTGGGWEIRAIHSLVKLQPQIWVIGVGGAYLWHSGQFGPQIVPLNQLVQDGEEEVFHRKARRGDRAAAFPND